MNSNQTLEIEIKSTGEKSLKVINDLMKSITGIENVLTNIYLELGHIETKTGNVKTVAKSTTDEVKKGVTSVSNAVKSINFNSIINGIKQLYNAIKSSSDRAEELNLFNVVFKNIEKDGVKTFSTLGLEATRFQYKLNETFGTNMTDTLRYQALFQSMGENAGIGDKYANIMSENLTKLTYDLASLYNRSEKETAEALKSGIYGGQTKPLRKFGVDVTQGSISPILAQIGITDRTVSQMSQAEKEILRYIGTLNQAKVAMKDFAQTIESPANQLKVLRNQFEELKVAVGNLFVGMFAQILPYANAILMVLKEIAKAIANLFNIQVTDFNSGLGALDDTEEAYVGIGNGAAGAAKAAKELNRQTLKFDQINNIKSPTKSSSGGGTGSGGGLSGGIDKRLLEALKGYDNLMDKVKMKATEIRDRWLDILGFKKVINPITGEVSFKYQGLSTTIKNIAKWFGNLSSRAKLFVGLGVAVAIAKIYEKAKALFGILGGTGLLKTTTDLLGKMKYGLSLGGDITKNLSGSIQLWRRQNGIIGDNVTTFQKITNGAKEFAKGAGIALAGVLTLNAAMEDMHEDGITWANSMEGLAGSLMTTFGAMQAGAVFGPIGAMIGGIAGGIYSLITAISGIGEAADREKAVLEEATEAARESYDEWTNTLNRMKDTMTESDSQMEYYEDLKKELDSIVDKNGKIKKGYEDRAETIINVLNGALGTEMEIVDGVVQKYKEVEEEIDKLILQKKAMAKLNILEEEYNTALKEQKQAKKDLADAQALLNGYISDQNILVEDFAKKMGMTNEETIKLFEEIRNNPFGPYTQEMKDAADEYFRLNGYIDEQTKVYQANIDKVDSYQETIKTFEKAYGLSLKKDYKALEEYIDGEAQLLGISDTERKVYWRNQINKANKGFDDLLKNRDKYSKEELDKLWEANNQKLKYAQDHYDQLEAITKTKNGEITDEVIQQWIKMGEESVENTVLEFQKLPTDIQNKLKEKMAETGTDLGSTLRQKMESGATPESQELTKKAISIINQLQKGFNSVKLEKSVTITAKDNASSTINSIINKYKNNPLFAPLFKAIGAAKGGSFYRGNYSIIPQFANGGSPSHGTLFAAGENGAEIVGNINRRTEVLNRSQIASAIYSAVASAMSNANIGGGEVHLYAHTDEGVIIDRINSKTKQTGRCPINIPA